MLNIALFGPPGSGKGTQSKFIINKYHLVYISTGDILREQISLQTALGIQAKQLIDHGHLVPDELVVQLIEDKLNNGGNANGFLFDGFPRTCSQAEILEQILKKRHMNLNAMVSLEVPQTELVQRLLDRASVQGRSDDTKEVIEARFKEYASKTMPVIDFYKSLNKYHPVDGVGSLEDIFARIQQVIDNI
ncbi:MAG: adenylate kinase [Bacteroidales bacterium]|nr:adenylate kinase [Bacteroidales bacterium]